MIFSNTEQSHAPADYGEKIWSNTGHNQKEVTEEEKFTEQPQIGDGKEQGDCMFLSEYIVSREYQRVMVV